MKLVVRGGVLASCLANHPAVYNNIIHTHYYDIILYIHTTLGVYYYPVIMIKLEQQVLSAVGFLNEYWTSAN